MGASEQKKAGNGNATRGKRLSAGAVVIRGTESDIEFLLLRAFRHWDFPKGMVEDGETPLQAAIREIEEETLLADLVFDWGETFYETGPYSRGKIARYYLARTGTEQITLPVNPDLGRPEHSEYRWVGFIEALQLTSPRLKPVIHWAANILNLD